MKDQPAVGDSSKPELAGAALSPLQRAFLALEKSRARIAALEQSAREPIAVIGMGCRVPGGANTPADFWQLMRDGVDAISRVPSERWDIDALYDSDPSVPGRIATREGGFLADVDQFDPAFFGIAPREAQGMDPQQRLLLEVAWEALEHAGQAPDALGRSRTGVYVGVTASDYAYLQLKSGDASLLDAHFTSGIAHSIFSGRISYLLGLQGPSVTLDTACSSSLVAVHLACQALRSGECRMALAGGVNLILAPDLFIALSHSRMLAPDGRCKTFDAAADGFARGEGCGVVVLKKLSDAEADGDRILAVIRGSAVNQDGPSSGLTAPNGPAQEAVIRDALAQAGLAPREVGYLEAHGTGTQLGDPLEVTALGAVFGADRAGIAPLWLGSVKTNVGHLEAAAGIVGLIKIVLSMQHGAIPAHLHFRNPSPHIAWDDYPIHVPTALTDWAPIDGRRIAGVSSFGFSGTNAHVVLSDYRTEAPSPVATRLPCLFTLSAPTAAALSALASRHARALRHQPDADLAAVCHTANAGRAQFSCRAALLVDSIAQLCDSLEALAAGQGAEGMRTADVSHRDPPRVAFVFTGQGSQYAGMAAGLYRDFPAFRAALDECAGLLDPELARPLLEVIHPSGEGAGELDQTAFTQPALFAVEYALAQLWKSWGIAPVAVAGHSVGEWVAACLAGVFSLADALKLIALRGRLMQSLPAGGGMAAVGATEQAVIALLAGRANRVSIAAVNGPAQTVLSGPLDQLAALEPHFRAAGHRWQSLTVSHAFHSPLVDPVLDEFERAVSAVERSAPTLRLISNLTGKAADAADIRTPGYWRRHVREAVRFADTLATLGELRIDTLIEIGPHPTLLSFAGAVYGDAGPVRVASLRKGADDRRQLLEALASLYLAGARIDWKAVAGRTSLVDLPLYPFQRERCWFAARPGARAPTDVAGAHPLLGARLRSAGSEIIHESLLGAEQPRYVRDHRVLDHVVLPATAYLEMLLASARDAFGAEGSVADVVIQEAMLLDDNGDLRQVQTVRSAAADAQGALLVSIASSPPEGSAAWTTHVTAKLRRDAAAWQAGSLDEARGTCTHEEDVPAFYASLAQRGLQFGEFFRPVARLWRGEGQALGEIRLTDSSDAGTLFHPALLDGCLQVLAAALPADGDVLFMPIAIGSYRLAGRPTARCWSHVLVRAAEGDTRSADVSVFDESGRPLARIAHVSLKRASRASLERMGERWLDESLLAIRWQEQSLADPAGPWEVSPAGLVAHAAQASTRLANDAGIAAYDPFLRDLESLCAEYTAWTMARLGWEPVSGELVREDSLRQRLGVLPRHERLFHRLLAILAEAGYLAWRAGEGWRVLKVLPQEDPAPAVAKLESRCPPGAGAELEMTARVAADLPRALCGDTDPMQLLFPGGSTENAERMYRDSPTAKYFNGLVAELGEQILAAARRGGRRLRVLEVGGGTGGTTAHLLPRIAGSDVEYTFTDVGPLFVARAAERFGSHPGTRFQVLDLEKDPLAQGLSAGHFDVVVAANVIHATADLAHTFAGLRRLLVPGGLIAMLEVTEPQRWFDLTVGLTEGWWAFTDTALRPDYATLSREAWFDFLRDNGFDEMAALPAESTAGSCLGLQSLIVARLGAKAAGLQRHWLVVQGGEGALPGLVDRLRARGDACSELPLDADVAPAELTARWRAKLAQLRAQGTPVTDVVHAGLLGIPKWDDAASPAEACFTPAGVTGVLSLAQALIQEQPHARLNVLTRGAQPASVLDRTTTPLQAAAWGLARTMALEYAQPRCICIDLDPAQGDESEIDRVVGELLSTGDERQVALRAGQRRVARLQRTARAAQPLPAVWRLVPSQPGSLDGFTFQPEQRRAPGVGEVEIEVAASALNFKDVLNALGMYPGNPGPLGGECAGRVVAVGPGVSRLRPGDEVMAVAGGSLASNVIARVELVQRLPEGISAEEGASFSIAYLTAAFCLDHLAGIAAGERVLIHAAAGGVGMAAVRLALRTGAEVFATAGDERKRALLRAMGVQHVLDSRSNAFVAQIRAATGGRGVDVVLNSLAGELIDASFDVLASGGRFVEIGKRGIKDHAWVDAQQRNWRYFIVDWGETAAREPELIGGLYEKLARELAEGTLSCLPLQVYDSRDAARAFRFMAQARHAGKIVLRHPRRRSPIVRRGGCYLITGGLSGLGLQASRWLASHGATRLVLLGRRGVTAEAQPVLQELQQAGVTVIAEAIDVADEAAMQALLERVRAGGRLHGIVHSAGVLDDAALLQQDAAHFATVFAPKVAGAWLLDRLTRIDQLDWFVSFSSVAAVLGSPGQANHAAANALLDALAHERSARGLPSFSVNWGAWSEIGAAAGKSVASRIADLGLMALTPAQGLAALQRVLEGETKQVAVAPIDWSRYLARLPGAATPFLAEFTGADGTKAGQEATATQVTQPALRSELADAPPGRRRAIVAAFVRERALKALGIDPSRTVDPRTSLNDLGLDSLLAVELRNTLSNALGCSLPATLLFDYPNMNALTDFLLAELQVEAGGEVPVVQATQTPAGGGEAGLVGSIESMSDDEVERMLAERSRRAKAE